MDAESQFAMVLLRLVVILLNSYASLGGSSNGCWSQKSHSGPRPDDLAVETLQSWRRATVSLDLLV